MTDQEKLQKLFDADMKQMMGGEGKTMGDPASRMQQAFGDMREEHGEPAKTRCHRAGGGKFVRMGTMTGGPPCFIGAAESQSPGL